MYGHDAARTRRSLFAGLSTIRETILDAAYPGFKPLAGSSQRRCETITHHDGLAFLLSRACPETVLVADFAGIN
jgi:hypothetical protein